MPNIPYRRVHYLPPGRHPHKKLLNRFRLVLALGFVALVIFALFNLVVSAQQSGAANDGEDAFNAKSDKLLKHVYHVARKRPAATKAVPRTMTDQASPQADADIEIDRLSRLVGLERAQDGVIKASVIAHLAKGGAAELEAAGFPVGARIGDIVTVETVIDRLPELASLTSVRNIEAAVYSRPLNDRARQAVGIDNSSGQRVVSQTGLGVVVGIIDSGIDFRHPDFTVAGSNGQRTRIKALLDMTYYGAVQPGQSIPADPGWNYTLPGGTAPIGHLYTEADINAALQAPKPADQNNDIVKERDTHGHGTHVTGTAAGNGLAASSAPGVYAGMAPEADLVIVKASRQNNGGASFRTTDTINALQFIQQKAAELNEPFVINMSLGGQLGPHDGTTLGERAIDALVNSGPGRAVCVAAGNEGDANIHASGTVPPGGDLTLEFNANSNPQFIDLYYHNPDRFSVTITRPDGTTAGTVPYNADGFKGSPAIDDQFMQVFNANDDKGDSDPTNDQPDFFVIFKKGAPTGNWKFSLHGDTVNSGRFDAWATGGDVSFATFVDNSSHLVGSPGTSRGAITVGAYVTRSASLTVGGYAPFSSPGPTADGRQKPEISAPGYYLYSSRSTDINSANGVGFTYGSGANAAVDSVHYGGLAGTSMATPVTTGAVALLLQANPSLTSDQIKTYLTNNTDHDSFDPPGWDPHFGFGKLDIAAAIGASSGLPRTYSISGRVVNSMDSDFSGTTITLSGSQTGATQVDANGNYSFRNLLAGGNYTLTPSKPNYTFSPAGATFNNLRQNQTAPDFTATAVYTISGQVRDLSGKGVSDIFVSITAPEPQLTKTDSNGNYAFVNLPGGQREYRVAPSSTAYIFTPDEQDFYSLRGNQIANFTATPIYKVRGRVVDGNGFGVSGVLMSVVGVRVSDLATTDSSGNYSFMPFPVGSSGTVTPSFANHTFTPSSQTFSNLSGNLTLDNFVMSSPPSLNQIDDARFFVTQHYHDFLNRDPDQGGLDYWTGQLTACGNDAKCMLARRVTVSAAYFTSDEFQQTGYYVYRFYKASLGRQPKFNEFMADRSQVVGGATLDTGKALFADQWVKRADFLQLYSAGMSNTDYVTQLYTRAQLDSHTTEQQQAIADLNGGSKTRAQVLREMIEIPEYKAREYNAAFVMMQYFGYLRRDYDQDGYNFWLGVMNGLDASAFKGMTCAFITSAEYQLRFSTNVTHTNRDCGQ